MAATVAQTNRFELRANHLARYGEPSRDEWEAYGEKLSRMSRSLNFVVGDWLVYGEDHGWVQPATFYDVAKQFDRTYEWASQCVRVAREFPPHLRKPNVAWSSYREALVAPKEVRPRLIEKASEQKWTKDEMIRQTGRRVSASRKSHKPRPTKWGGRNVVCPHCNQRFQIT